MARYARYGIAIYGEDRYSPTNQSPSTHPRFVLPDPLQRPTLTGGTVDVRTRVYRSDLTNTLGGEITHLIGRGGEIVVDKQRAIHGTVRLETNDPSVLPAWSYVAVHQEITYESRPTVTRQVGLYRMGQPESTGRPSWSPTEATGEDPTRLLRNYRYSAPMTIAPGLTCQTLMQGLLYRAGVRRYRIPATTKEPGYHHSFPANTSSWEIAKVISTIAGWLPVYAADDGALETRPMTRPSETEPARTYVLGQDARVLGDPRVSRTDAEFANVIVVSSENPTRTPLRTTVRNDDPGDPHSTTYPGGPGVVAASLIDNDIEDALVLELAGLYELIRRGVAAETTVQLAPDSALRIDDVIDLVAPPDMPHLATFAGRWTVEQKRYGLDTGVMTVRARKIEGRLYGRYD